MKDQCRLLFAFANLKKDDMSSDYLSRARELISGVRKGEKRSVMVTFGLYAAFGKPINIHASVNIEGKHEPLEDAKDGYYENLMANYLPDGMGVFLISMEVADVLFESDGLYEVNVRVYPANCDPQDGLELDAVKSAFYVLTQKD